jgi:CheY-like chemotaxis protein
MILADKGNIEQVIMNLLVNARDAMAGRGVIRVRTQDLTLDEEYAARNYGARPGKFVCLSVEDDGKGIDKKTQKRIFEPFFTTKATGKGTGLGLSMVYGIVKNHDGWINVYSEPGKGTIFRLYFPATHVCKNARTEESIRLQTFRGSGERILFVEDNEFVRNFAKKALGEYGYRVLDAKNASEAQALFAREAESLQMVLSDVVLPDLNGVELVEGFRAQKPGIGVLLNSGYSGEKLELALAGGGGYRFIQKPYSLHDLLRAVSETLGAN